MLFDERTNRCWSPDTAPFAARRRWNRDRPQDSKPRSSSRSPSGSKPWLSACLHRGGGRRHCGRYAWRRTRSQRRTHLRAARDGGRSVCPGRSGIGALGGLPRRRRTAGPFRTGTALRAGTQVAPLGHRHRARRRPGSTGFGTGVAPYAVPAPADEHRVLPGHGLHRRQRPHRRPAGRGAEPVRVGQGPGLAHPGGHPAGRPTTTASLPRHAG